MPKPVLHHAATWMLAVGGGISKCGLKGVRTITNARFITCPDCIAIKRERQAAAKERAAAFGATK